MKKYNIDFITSGITFRKRRLNKYLMRNACMYLLEEAIVKNKEDIDIVNYCEQAIFYKNDDISENIKKAMYVFNYFCKKEYLLRKIDEYTEFKRDSEYGFLIPILWILEINNIISWTIYIDIYRFSAKCGKLNIMKKISEICKDIDKEVYDDYYDENLLHDIGIKRQLNVLKWLYEKDQEFYIDKIDDSLFKNVIKNKS